MPPRRSGSRTLGAEGDGRPPRTGRNCSSRARSAGPAGRRPGRRARPRPRAAKAVPRLRVDALQACPHEARSVVNPDWCPASTVDGAAGPVQRGASSWALTVSARVSRPGDGRPGMGVDLVRRSRNSRSRPGIRSPRPPAARLGSTRADSASANSPYAAGPETGATELQHRGRGDGGGHRVPRSVSASAICSAFRAAPIRRLSATTQSQKPRGLFGLTRIRPTCDR